MTRSSNTQKGPLWKYRSAEQRSNQLWILALFILCFLAATIVILDTGNSDISVSKAFPYISHGLLRIGIVLSITLLCAYLWEKMHELNRSNELLLDDLEHYTKSLEHRNEELSALNILSEKLMGSVEVDSSLRTVLEIALKATQATNGYILLLDSENNELIVKASQGLPDDLPLNSRITLSESCMSVWVLENIQPLSLKDNISDPRTTQYTRSENEVFSSICVPMLIGHEVIGILNVSEHQAKQEFNQSDLVILTAFANQAATVVERNQLYSQLRAHVTKLEETLRQCDESKLQSLTDPLTELGNRRNMNHSLITEYQRAKRYKRPFSLIILDLDEFKGFNDTHGHMAGDLLLKRLGQILRSNIRSEATVSRYGGDEFVILLPECDERSALQVGDRLRSIIHQELKLEESQEGMTASLGISCYPQDASTPEELFQAADRALYKSKKLGKNQVSTHSQI